MPSKTKKPLYIAKNLSELNTKTGNAERVKEGQCRIFAKTSAKLYTNADESDLLGDEERAYVLYMKFLNITQAVRKTAEYKKNNKYFDDMIGMKKLPIAMEKAETLSESLKMRYEESEAQEVSAKLEELTPDVEEKSVTEEISPEKINGEVNENVDEKVTNEKQGFITCEKLYNLMTDTKESTNFLIMDIRPNEQYDTSRINYQHCVNVPKDIIPAGCTVPRIEAKLSNNSMDEWHRRGIVDFIILMDWTCGESSLDTGSPLRCLKDAIYKWDQDTVIKSEPLLLEGGYDEWISMYPTLTTNASIPRPMSNNSVVASVISLDKIDYDLELNFLKTAEQLATEENLKNQALRVTFNGPEPVEQNIHMPIIPDRNTKPNNHIINTAPKQNINNINIIKNDFSIPKTTVSLSDLRRKIEPGDNVKQIQAKDVNIRNDRQALKIDTKPITPTIDRTSKPKLNASSDSNMFNDNSLPSVPTVNNHEDESSLSDEKVAVQTDAEVKELNQQHDTKQQELEASRTENKRLALETEARRAKLETEKKKLEEAKADTAEVLRKKQALTDELDQLEKEKEQRLAEQKRTKELEHIKVEEQKKKKMEADRLREERLKQEQEQQQQRIKQMNEKHALEEKNRQELERQEKERLQHEEQKLKAKQAAKAAKAREEQQLLQARLEQERGDIERKTKEDQARKSVSLASVKERALPIGWDKQFDSTQNKYYYINHHTKKTQWEFPSIKPDSSGVYKTKLKTEDDQQNMGGGLKRSHSSPNIAKMMEDEDRKMPPTVSRDFKPQAQVVSSLQKDRSILEAKVRNFNPIWGSVGHGLSGLRNQGNTCYMNSTLQCMSNTAFLTSYVLTGNYRYDINRKNKFGTRGEIAEEYAAVVKAMWSGQYRSITPKDFKLSCARHCDTFAGYDQQDSQELVAYLLSWLHEDLNKIHDRRTLPEQKNDNIPDEVAAEKAWVMHKSIHDSVIGQLFQGQTKSTLICKACDKKSVTFETFYDLSLDIPSQSRCTLKDCLLSWSKEEKMTGDSKWNCPSCRVPREATKRIVIWRLPPILIIVLKRFNHTGMWRQKNSAYVDFPIDDVDFNKYISGPATIRKPYNLYAMSNHYGTMEGGHYTAFCKNYKLNRWFKFDDHEVYEYSKSDIKTSAAYFLFYSSM